METWLTLVKNVLLSRGILKTYESVSITKSLLNLSVPHSCPGVAGGSGWLADPDPHEEYGLGFGSRRLIILVHARSKNLSLSYMFEIVEFKPLLIFKFCKFS